MLHVDPRPFIRRRDSQKGTLLFTMLVLIVLISLGSVMVVMFSSSSLQQVYENMGLRASYLAEAGYRYAASEYKNAATLKAKLQRLQTLNNQNIAFSNNDGSFSLKVYPYWFITPANYSAGATSINAVAPGEFPVGFSIPATGRLKIGFYSYDYTSRIQTSPNVVQFTIQPPGLLENISSSSSLYLTFNPPSAQTVNKNGNVIISSDNGNLSLFPERNGQFEVGGITYTYKERQLGSVILSNVTSASDGNFPLRLKTDTDIMLKKQALIESTGSVGTGLSQATRPIHYNVTISDEISDPNDTAQPLPLSNQPGGQDTFQNLNNWEVRDPGKTRTGYRITSSHGTYSYYVTFVSLAESQDPDAEGEVSYEWVSTSLSTGSSITAIWGTGGSNIYAVDNGGEAWRFNGTAWSLLRQTSNQENYGLWGFASDDIHSAGTYRYRVGRQWIWGGLLERNWSSIDGRQYDNVTFRGIWGSSANSVYTVGTGGTICYYNGTAWSSMSSGTSVNLFSVWGAASNDVYAVGNSGTIRHYNGSTWSGMSSGTSQNLFGIWGSGPNDVYVVGNNGTILRYNGTAWSSMSSGTSVNLSGIWGTSSTNIYAVGNNGTILHYDGSAWSSMSSGTTRNLYSVWGFSSTDVFVGGENGTILRYTGSMVYTPIKFHLLPLDKNAEFASEWGSSQGLLSYTVQTKHGWGYLLNYAADGICLRWHKPAAYPTKEQGYGISLMYYSSETDPGNPNYDYIPTSIKPYVNTPLDRANRPLVVLWKQTVVNGTEHRQWLAFKDLTGDSKFIGGQWQYDGQRFNDSSSLFIRVHEKKIDGVKLNDINVYYGDASTIYAHVADTLYNNTGRSPYYPTYDTGQIGWPPWYFYPWLTTDDFVTVVDNVHVAASPQPPAPGSPDYWYVNPGATGIERLSDGHTIRTNFFTSPDYPGTFPGQTLRSEVGLHVFGNIGAAQQQTFISFEEFAVQLGTTSSGSQQESGFGRLQ